MADALLAGEKLLLEMITRGDRLALILDALCRLAEERCFRQALHRQRSLLDYG